MRRPSTVERLAHLLEEARRQSGVSAVALADGQGLLIAGAGRYSSCEDLAAWAPLSSLRGRVASIEVWGQRVHLCASNPQALAPRAEGLLDAVRFALAPTLRWVA